MFRRLITIATGGMAGVVMLAIVSIRVATLFGAGADLDAYLVAVSGPALLVSFAATMAAPLITPRLSVLSAEAAARRAGEWALLTFIASVALASILILGRDVVTEILAPGLDQSSAQIASRVMAIYCLSLPATLASTVYSAYGFATGRVWTNGVSATAYGATWLLLLFVPWFTHSVSMVAFACVLASQVQLASAFAASTPPGHKPWPRWRRIDKPFLALGAVAAVGANAVVGKANLILDPILGSLGDQGDVTVLVYATRLMIVAVAICGTGPALMVLGGRRSGDDARNPLARDGLGVTVLIAAGLATAVAIAFEPTAKLLLAHGQFTAHDAEEVGRLVQQYSPAIVLTTLAWSLESTLYSMGYTWTIVLCNLPCLALNVILSLTLLPSINLTARPVAVSTAMGAYVVLLSLQVRRSEDGFNVLRAVPVFSVARVVVLIAAICLATTLADNVLGSPAVWAVVALALAAAVSIAAARAWLETSTLQTPEPRPASRSH